MFELKSIKNKNLKKKQMVSICKLKDSHWKFGFKSQLNYFKKNIKSFDIHNCLYIKDRLVGYTLLRKRRFNTINNTKKMYYLLFDTLIIKKKYRKKKLSTIMMLFNNNIIVNEKLPSFLICKNSAVNFYKKNNWRKIDKKKVRIMDHKFNTNGMFYNFDILNKKKFIFNKSLIKIYMNK